MFYVKTKFMYLTLFIYSKNLNSITNFLKLFYKIKNSKNLKLKLYTVQSLQKKKFSFFSVLQSPHVNKKSQEQFEYYVYKKQLKIYVVKFVTLLKIWKFLQLKLFSDLKFNFSFALDEQLLKSRLPVHKSFDSFLLKIYHNKKSHFSARICANFLKILDIHGEILLKSY